MPRTIRLPVSALVNQRIATISGSPAASGVVGIGVVGTMIVNNATQTTDKDGRALNCYPQTVSDPSSGQKRVYLVRRPGSVTSLTPQAGSIGNAIAVAAGGALAAKIFSAFGATNSSIYDSATQLVTNNGDTTVITGRATGITETDLSGTATLLISSSDNTCWSYQAAGTVTKVADADFPGNNSLVLAGTFAHLDGFACIMTTTGRLYASDVNSVTAWSANSYESTSAYPDGGIGCIRRKQNIMAFGRDSVEFFRNAGNTPFPFQRIQDATIKVGAVHANAIAQISDSVFWGGTTPEGGLSVFKFDGAVGRVSTPEIDAILVLHGASNITLSTLRYGGRSFVLVLCSGVDTYAYCIEENSWNLWKTASYPLWYKTASASTGSSLLTYMLSNLATAGRVYVLNQSSLSFTDAGDSYSTIIQWPLQDFGSNKRKFWHEVTIIGDKETSAANVTISYSDDDYQNASGLGTVDMSGTRPVLHRAGSGRRRGWYLTHSSNTPLRVEGLEMRVTEGAT